MIDVYIRAGKIDDTGALARNLATTLMRIEGVPDIAMFRQNTAAFIHELPPGSISNVDGDEDCCRVQVLTNLGALDRAKQLRVVAELTGLIADATDDSIRDRIWVLLTEAPDGGWGLNGHANTNEELVAAARAELAKGSGA
ncbi:tautomerase family protein [Kribbella kalugense]|nr:tautomerase family protein [Kribbella kalugense]